MSYRRDKSIGALFQAETKYRRGKLPARIGREVPRFKVYVNPREVAALPVPELEGGRGLWSALAAPRAAIPEGGRLRLRELSQIMWTTAGFTRAGGSERAHITLGSISGLETYVIIRSVEDIFKGIYHYDSRDHALEQLERRNGNDLMAECLIGETHLDAAAALIIYTGLITRMDDGAQSRAYRYLYLEAGAAAQCAVLAASSLGLSATLKTEFYDDELAKLLEVDGKDEFPLCMVMLGT